MLTKEMRKRIKNRVGIATFEKYGKVDPIVVFEIADNLGVELTTRQAKRLATEVAKEYGF